MTNIFKLATDTQALETARKLAADPTASYMDLFGSADGTSITVAGVTYPNLDQVFAQPALHTSTRAKSLAEAEGKLQAAIARIEKTKVQLDAQLARNAGLALKAIPGGPEEVKVALLMRRFTALNLFANPEGTANGINKKRLAADGGEKVVWLCRFGGSARLRLAPGESAADNQARLEATLLDQRPALAAVLDLAPGKTSPMAYAVRSQGEVPGNPGVIAYSVVYGLKIENVKLLETVIKKLEAVEDPFKLINPLVADNDTLQLNSDEYEQLDAAVAEVELATETARRDELVQDLGPVTIEGHTETELEAAV